jgi:hypothetical protein
MTNLITSVIFATSYMEAWDVTKKLGLDFRTCYWAKSFSSSKLTSYKGLNIVYSDTFMKTPQYHTTRVCVASTLGDFEEVMGDV